MELGRIDNKEIREFLRASELLLGLLRNAQDSKVSAYELMLIWSYVASLKGALLQIENTALLQAAKDPKDTAPQL